MSAAPKWEVVGGGDKGGILVRAGQEVTSDLEKDRLSTGATIEQIALNGERLNYKLLEGTGPAVGWVSIKLKDKTLVEPKIADDIGGPGDKKYEVDEDLKKKYEAASKKREPDFLNYCMKYKVFGGPVADCKLRVVCFHNAGGAESNYTRLNTPFTKWVKETKQVEILAPDFPGRDKLAKEKKLTSTDTLVPDMMEILYSKLADGTPWCVWSHSMGTMVAFEFLMLARKLGLPEPKLAFFNAFGAPHMHPKKRKYRKSQSLNDAQMREELLLWDKGHLGGAGKVVFDAPAWKDTWEPMMRADFRVFDEYVFKHDGAAKFDFPIYSWHMTGDHYNDADHIELWKDWAGGEFGHQTLDMGHLTCFYKKEFYEEYFTKVTDILKPLIA